MRKHEWIGFREAFFWCCLGVIVGSLLVIGFLAASNEGWINW